tara:strand:+ start:1095 stop:1502 length:408 start_codon:yes stop_codon:yes gene_type:complete
MENKLINLISNLFIFILIFTINTGLFSFEIASASEKQKSYLIERVSSDFTRKFCNSIGFGLSEQSALNFSFLENKKVFENRKDFQDINKELLADKIAISVINNCGYKLGLEEEKDIEDFANLYLSFEKENSKLIN